MSMTFAPVQATAQVPVADDLLDAELAIESAETERYFKREVNRIRRAGLPKREEEYAYARLISEAFGENPTTGHRYYTPLDVLEWFDRAAEMEAAPPNHGPKTLVALYRRELIPNAIFRKRFLELHADSEEPLTAGEVGMRIGEVRARKDTRDKVVGDATRVERLLGLAITRHPRSRAHTLTAFLTYEKAVQLADALDLPYHDCGV